MATASEGPNASDVAQAQNHAKICQQRLARIKHSAQLVVDAWEDPMQSMRSIEPLIERLRVELLELQQED